jgi:nucleotide-binding universal stress UspA family protein
LEDLHGLFGTAGGNFRKGDKELMIKKILVATDGSDYATKGIEFASDLAAKYKATVYLIHVFTPLSSMPEIDGGVLQQWEDLHEKQAKEIIEEAERVVKKRGVENYQATLLRGHPAQEIIEFARKTSVDMIVMGSRGAGKLEMLMLGSVSNKVCHLADCSCVTIK